jgi:hypothetical protein
LADRVGNHGRNRGRNLGTLTCASAARRENSFRIGLEHHVDPFHRIDLVRRTDLAHRIDRVWRTLPCSSTARSHAETVFDLRTCRQLIVSVILASPALDLVSVRPRQRRFRYRSQQHQRIRRLHQKCRRPRRPVAVSHQE